MWYDNEKFTSQHAPEALQNLARHVPQPSKIDARDALSSQHAPQSAQETPKRCPRSAQEEPRAAQEPPREVQNNPRDAPGAPLGPPRVAKDVKEEATERQKSF